MATSVLLHDLVFTQRWCIALCDKDTGRPEVLEGIATASRYERIIWWLSRITSSKREPLACRATKGKI